VKPAAFDYVRPRSIEEAIAALSGTDAKIIAGGQSLVPMMNFRLVQPQLLIDINGIEALAGIDETIAGLRIGAMVRHSEAMTSERLARNFPIIAEAMRHVAHPAIRDRGTIGGSLAHADPSAEWPLLVTLMDAEIELASAAGPRRITPDAFFITPLVTAIEEDEILTAVHIAKLHGGIGMAFDEIGRRQGDFAMVAAGAVLRLRHGTIDLARMALGGVGPVPVRAEAAEEFLQGKEPTTDNFRQAATLAAADLHPTNDMHASAEYRLHLVPAMLRRVLDTASARAVEASR
jgi:carbon-monoxide dehydrogenase medium subunit